MEELDVLAGVILKKIENFALQNRSPHKDTESFGSTVVGLSGDLGAGKTTFSKCVAARLGVKEVVTSPTFGIQKQYKAHGADNFGPQAQIFKEFVHIDAYRIEDLREVETLRFVELFQKPKTLIFIEWPEKIEEVLPKDTILLSFEAIDENTRKISY